MLTFSKDWTNAEDFPTYEGSEEQVRADMQLLHNETRDYINEHLDSQDYTVGSGDTLSLLLPSNNVTLFVANNGYALAGGILSSPFTEEHKVGMSDWAVESESITVVLPDEDKEYMRVSFTNQRGGYPSRVLKVILLAGDPASEDSASSEV